MLARLRMVLAHWIAPVPIQAKGTMPTVTWNNLPPVAACDHSHQRWDGSTWTCVGCGATSPRNTSLVGTLTVTGDGWKN